MGQAVSLSHPNENPRPFTCKERDVVSLTYQGQEEYCLVRELFNGPSHAPGNPPTSLYLVSPMKFPLKVTDAIGLGYTLTVVQEAKA